MPSPLSRPEARDDFALRDERVLDAAKHLLVADAFAAHVVAVLAEQVAHLVVQTVFDGQFLGDDFGNFLRHELGIGVSMTPGISLLTSCRRGTQQILLQGALYRGESVV